MPPDSRSADLAALGQWLVGWVQPDGAIHGFHNHSIWGSNPYRVQDFTAGHSTFAAPLLMALANLLRAQPDERASELLRRIARFQIASLQPDGQYAHIGFQCGEMLQWGLIHNAVPNVALAYVLAHARGHLDDALAEAVRARVTASLAALDRIYPNQSLAQACTNQEYTRTWARLLLAHTTRDEAGLAAALRELDRFIAAYHRFGFPDAESAGSLRGVGDENYLEPAEYYGLQIAPLTLAYRITQEPRYLEAALAFARHVVRSSWIDAEGCRRLHRTWHRVAGQWHHIHRPMCISGSGLSGHAIAQLNAIAPAKEFADFIGELQSTYAHYQHPAGFFPAGADWHSELDVAPCTAWHAHDFLFLAEFAPRGESFWDRVFGHPEGKVDVLLGSECFYAEDGVHWAIGDYVTTDTFRLRGRKDRGHFFREHFAWIETAPRLPSDFLFPRLPQFVRTDDGAVLQAGDPAALRVKAMPGLRLHHGQGQRFGSVAPGER